MALILISCWKLEVRVIGNTVTRKSSKVQSQKWNCLVHYLFHLNQVSSDRIKCNFIMWYFRNTFQMHHSQYFHFTKLCNPLLSLMSFCTHRLRHILYNDYGATWYVSDCIVSSIDKIENFPVNKLSCMNYEYDVWTHIIIEAIDTNAIMFELFVYKNWIFIVAMIPAAYRNEMNIVSVCTWRVISIRARAMDDFQAFLQ